MPLRSRRTETHKVEVANDLDEKLSVSVRALRPFEESWILDRHIEAKDITDLNAWVPTNLSSFARDYVKFGLVEVHDETDPDTGKPFELKHRVLRIGERSVEIVNDESVDVIHEWIAAIFSEISNLTHLTPEEKKGVGFTSPSPGQSDSKPVKAATEMSSTVPSAASSSESSSA